MHYTLRSNQFTPYHHGTDVVFMWNSGVYIMDIHQTIKTCILSTFIPSAPWCTARCTRYFDTKLHGILPWADINRHCNTFFLLRVYSPRGWSLQVSRSMIQNCLVISLFERNSLPSKNFPCISMEMLQIGASFY